MQARERRKGGPGRFGAAAIAVACLAMIVAGGLLSGCGSSSSSGSGGKYEITLSNNYMGNAWRPQMVNAVEHVAKTQYGDKVDLNVVNADNTLAAQISSLQSIIRQKPDAIITDAASSTGLNPTIQQACDAGIKVISFDQTATAPCGYQLQYGYSEKGHDMAEWMAKTLGGKGDVILDQAIPGAAAADAINKAVTETLADYPGIDIVGKYQSQYAAGPEVQGVSSLLSEHPDIAGVISLMYCSSVNQAFKQAGADPVPSTCIGANVNAMACKKAGNPCFMYSAPPVVGALALQQAVEMLDGKSFPKITAAPKVDYTVNSDVKFDSKYPYDEVQAGKSYFPDESPDLFLPVTVGNLDLTPADVLK